MFLGVWATTGACPLCRVLHRVGCQGSMVAGTLVRAHLPARAAEQLQLHALALEQVGADDEQAAVASHLHRPCVHVAVAVARSPIKCRTGRQQTGTTDK